MTDEKLSRARPWGGCVSHNPDPERTGKMQPGCARKRDFVFFSRETTRLHLPGWGQVAEKGSGKMRRCPRTVGIDFAGSGSKKSGIWQVSYCEKRTLMGFRSNSIVSL